MREARRHSGALFFGIAEEDGELLDSGHGDVAPVIPREQGLRSRQRSGATAGSRWPTLPLRSRKNIADAMVVDGLNCAVQMPLTSEATGRDSWKKLFDIESQASMRGKSGEVKKEEALLHSPR